MNEVLQKLLLVIVVILFFLSGCVPPYRTKIDRGLILGTESKIEIGEITTDSPDEYSMFFAQGMLRGALKKALKKKEILRSDGTDEKYFILSIHISNYQMGDVFTRWVIPFYGAVVLKVECELTDSNNGEKVTKFEHKKSIVKAGVFSIKGWKSILDVLVSLNESERIFDLLAQDIATDLKRRMTDRVEGFYVELDPWPENESFIPKAEISQKIKLRPFKDKRLDKTRIGERQAAFNLSMGNVYLNRDIADYLTEALQNDLLASGNYLSNDDYKVILEGEIIRFWVGTDATPLYWDVFGEIEINLYAIDTQNDLNNKIEKTYISKSTSRTYIWPTQKIASDVISESIRKVIYDIRKDSIWINK